MRSRTLRSALQEQQDTTPQKKGLQHGFTWHTSTDRTAQESSCSSFESFGGDYDDRNGKKSNMQLPKRVVFADTSNRVVKIESLLGYTELWWDDEELMEIKGDCNVILRQQRKNHDLVDSITSILAQGMTDTHDPEIVKKFMSQMKQAQASRGLERDAVPPCAKLVQAHYKTVFETQKKLRQKQLIGSTRGTDTLARACEKSSKAFALLACRIAQHDVREAMRAAFTFADAGVMVKGKENRMQRRNSLSGVSKSAKLTMTAVNRRNSLTSSSTRGDNSAPDRHNVMAKRAGGLDRRKMLGHSVSMRSINNKYGSLGL